MFAFAGLRQKPINYQVLLFASRLYSHRRDSLVSATDQITSAERGSSIYQYWEVREPFQFCAPKACAIFDGTGKGW